MRTLGVVEHSLSVHQGGIEYTWRMYDVGGAVSLPLVCPTSSVSPGLCLAWPGQSSLNIVVIALLKSCARDVPGSLTLTTVIFNAFVTTSSI
jgi:hypothetical protein